MIAEIEALPAGGAAGTRSRTPLPNLAAGAIGLLTLAVCLVHIGTPSMWEDELATVSAATRPFGALLDLARHVDAALLPYYAFMHLWVLPTESDWWFRLPSALAMGGAAAGVVILGYRLHDLRAGILGGLAFCALPVVSRYGQEARVYALATCAVIWSTVLLVSFVRRGRLAAYAWAVVIVGLLQPFSLLVLGPHALWVLSERRFEFTRWVVWCAIASMPAAFLTMISAAEHSAGLQWAKMTWSAVGNLPSSLVGSRDTLFVGVVLIAAAWSNRRSSWAVLVAVLLPAAVLIVASAVAPVMVPRYILFVSAFAALLVGLAASRLSAPASAAVLLVLAISGLPVQQVARATHGEDWRGAAAVIDANQAQADRVVYAPGVWMQPMEHYLRGHMPPRAFATAGPSDDYAADQDVGAVRLRGVARVWEVVRDTDFGPSVLGRHAFDYLAPAQRTALAGFSERHVWRLRHIEIWLLSRG